MLAHPLRPLPFLPPSFNFSSPIQGLVSFLPSSRERKRERERKIKKKKNRRKKKKKNPSKTEILKFVRPYKRIVEFIFWKVAKKNSAPSDVSLGLRRIERGKEEREIAARFRTAIRFHSNQDLFANEGKHNTTSVLKERFLSFSLFLFFFANAHYREWKRVSALIKWMGPVLDESRGSLSILCDDRELICGQFIIHLSIPSSSLFSLCTVMRIMVRVRGRRYQHPGTW